MTPEFVGHVYAAVNPTVAITSKTEYGVAITRASDGVFDIVTSGIHSFGGQQDLKITVWHAVQGAALTHKVARTGDNSLTVSLFNSLSQAATDPTELSVTIERLPAIAV